MHPTTAQPGGLLPLLLPVVFIGLAILRNAQARNLVVERLWIMPAVILLLIGLAISRTPPTSTLGILVDVMAFAVGAALGWWRGRFTTITVNPETHALTSKASAAGMVFILVVFAARYLLRLYATESASVLHASANDVSDAILLLAVGLVCVQRLEMWLRARRLLADVRGAVRP